MRGARASEGAGPCPEPPQGRDDGGRRGLGCQRAEVGRSGPSEGGVGLGGAMVGLGEER